MALQTQEEGGGGHPRVVNTNMLRWRSNPLVAKVVSTRAPSSFAEDAVIESGGGGGGGGAILPLYFLPV